jgi:hypothetical protein
VAEDGVPAASASAAVDVVLVVLLVVDWVGAPGRALVGAAEVAGAVASGAAGVVDWAGAVVVVVVEEVVAGGV